MTRTIDKIMQRRDTRYGAPMGRSTIGTKDNAVGRIYDCKVPMCADGAYSKDGTYWGIGKELRVQYDKQLNYVRFYRVGDDLN